MKPYNERLPLIDEAIDTLKTWRTHKDYYIGDVGREANPFKLWKWVKDDLVFVCKKSTFNNRLSDWRVLYEWAMEVINPDSRPSFEDFVSDQRKSGEYQHIAESEGFVWEHHRAKEQLVKEREDMEKYEYGVEYLCNGEKPDLPDDVLVQVKNVGWDEIAPLSAKAGNWSWRDIDKFRIVDERYKPKSDWHDKGELPPVGAECEFTVDVSNLTESQQKALLMFGRVNPDKPVKCKVTHYGEKHFLYEHDGDELVTYIYGVNFRPLRTERDELIEKVDNMMNSPRQRKAIAEQIVDELILTESKDD